MVDPPDLSAQRFSLLPGPEFVGGENERKLVRQPQAHPRTRQSRPRCGVDASSSPPRRSRPTSYRPTSGTPLFTSRIFLVALICLLACIPDIKAKQDDVFRPSGNGVARRDPLPVTAQPWFNRQEDSAPLLAHRSALTHPDTATVQFSSIQKEKRQVPHSSSSSFTDLPIIRFFKREEKEECRRKPLTLGETIGFGLLVPILVLLSGVFAGLTLGYMSLDETQLHVLVTTGDPIQQERARKIIPIRKDGHLLLTTLLIANMITNETLPVIFDPLLPGAFVSVIISTVLIVIFSELIPQSTCSRYGLQIGAVMAFPTRIIICIFWPIAYPVSRILHWTLGPHHGIVYRRAELKELVTLHAASGGRGGDLNRDTVMIVGGALDLQEKVVKQAMTPIDKVFMLPFTAKLDYPTLEKVVRSGHSRIPIYVDVETSVAQTRSGTSTPKRKLNLLAPFTRKNSSQAANGQSLASDGRSTPSKDVSDDKAGSGKTVIRRKILGTLLVKQCVLLDPEDAVPVSSMVINALPTVPGDEPLLNVLNVFQEGRSHMAIVMPQRRRIGGSRDSTADAAGKSHLYHSSQGAGGPLSSSAAPRVDGLGNIDEEKNIEGVNERSSQTSSEHSDESTSSSASKVKTHGKRQRWRARFGLSSGEQDDVMHYSDRSDATLNKQQSVKDMVLKKVESEVSLIQEDDGDYQPIGIITLEDVLEELLCEEILDEYDDRGNEEQDFRSYLPPPSPEHVLMRDIPFTGDDDDKKLDEKAAQLFDGAYEKTEDASKEAACAPDASTMPNLELPSAMDTQPPAAEAPQQPKKTMLNMLGIGRQSKPGAKAQANNGQASETDLFASHGLLRRNTEANQARFSSPGMDRTGSHNPGYNSDSLSKAHPHLVRSSSVPPVGEGRLKKSDAAPAISTDVHLRSTDVTGEGADSQSTSAEKSAPASPALINPQPNRPIALRAQMPGGQPKTVIANESFLRGRTIAPSGAARAAASGHPTAPHGAVSSLIGTNALFSGGAALTPTNSSRSQTPVGNRGNRFKSQAAKGVMANFQHPAVANQAQEQQNRSRSKSAVEDNRTTAEDDDKADDDELE